MIRDPLGLMGWIYRLCSCKEWKPCRGIGMSERIFLLESQSTCMQINSSRPLCNYTKMTLCKTFLLSFSWPQIKKKWLLSGIDHLCPHPCGYSGYSCFKMVFPSPIRVQMAGLKHHELKEKKRKHSTDRISQLVHGKLEDSFGFFLDSPPPSPRGLKLKWGQKHL